MNKHLSSLRGPVPIYCQSSLPQILDYWDLCECTKWHKWTHKYNIHMHTHIHTHAHVHTCIWHSHAYTHAHTYTQACTSMPTSTHIHMAPTLLWWKLETDPTTRQSLFTITQLGLYSCIGRLVVAYFKCCVVLSLAGSGRYYWVQSEAHGTPPPPPLPTFRIGPEADSNHPPPPPPPPPRLFVSGLKRTAHKRMHTHPSTHPAFRIGPEADSTPTLPPLFVSRQWRSVSVERPGGGGGGGGAVGFWPGPNRGGPE